MIQTATPESFGKLYPSERGGVRILSLVQAYGVEQSFLRFWRGNTARPFTHGRPCRHRTPAGGTGRAVHFLTMQPEVRSVRTDEENARLLAALWPRSRLETGAVLTLRDRIVPTGPADLTSSPREIYPGYSKPALGKRFRPSHAWYADVSTVCGTASAVPQWLGEMGRPVACAMTVAQARDGAVLGAVATLPDYRSRGYASACVTTLAAVLQGRGGGSISVQKRRGAPSL